VVLVGQCRQDYRPAHAPDHDQPADYARGEGRVDVKRPVFEYVIDLGQDGIKRAYANEKESQEEEKVAVSEKRFQSDGHGDLFLGCDCVGRQLWFVLHQYEIQDHADQGGDAVQIQDGIDPLPDRADIPVMREDKIGGEHDDREADEQGHGQQSRCQGLFIFREPVRCQFGKGIEHERLSDGTSDHAGEEPAVTWCEDTEKAAQAHQDNADPCPLLQPDVVDAPGGGEAEGDPSEHGQYGKQINGVDISVGIDGSSIPGNRSEGHPHDLGHGYVQHENSQYDPAVRGYG